MGFNPSQGLGCFSTPVPQGGSSPGNHQFQSLSGIRLLFHCQAVCPTCKEVSEFQSLSGIRLLFHDQMNNIKASTVALFQSLSGIRLLFHTASYVFTIFGGEGFNPSQGLGCFSTASGLVTRDRCLDCFNPSQGLGCFSTFADREEFVEFFSVSIPLRD